MARTEKIWVGALVLLLFVFAFYAGKYHCWEQNKGKYQVSEGTFFKDWQIAAILALMVGAGILGHLPKTNNG